MTNKPKAKKTKRAHRKLDPAFKALKRICKALEECPEYMRRPNLEFAWDKYVTHR